MSLETNLKIALVHDHLAQDGGAERVLRSLQELFPGSPTFVLVMDPKRTNPFFQTQDIRTSFIQRLPLGVRRYQWFLPLMPTAIERFDFSGFDVVISSSSGLAKGIVTRPETLHLCYCHTPTRYLWSDTHSYVQNLPYPRLVKHFIPYALTHLRVWDRVAADRVDAFIANSEVVKQRISKYYKRDATVIYPPVDIDRFEVGRRVSDYFLTGGRLVPYKRFDLVIRACNALKLPLKIYGKGPAEKFLQSIAGPTVTFCGKVSDVERKKLYQGARAFINPQEEDFGITVVEAMASGRPVIAYGKGGATETVQPGVTGIFFDQQTESAMMHALKRFDETSFHPAEIRAAAERFSEQRFKKQLFDFVHEQYEIFNHL